MAGRWRCQVVGVVVLMLEGEGGNNQHYVRGAGRGRVTRGGGKVVVVRWRKIIRGAAPPNTANATLEVAIWQQGGGYEDSDGVTLAM